MGVLFSAAERVNEGQPYAWVPNSPGNEKDAVNSNSAAGKIANAADGGATDVSNFKSEPGHREADRVGLDGLCVF